MKNFPALLFPYILSIRIFASLLSIAGAFLYVFKLLNTTINHSTISYFLTTIFLIFIELGSILFLISFFRLIKNLKRKSTDIITVILFFIFAAGFLSLSYILTTNGASQWAFVRSEEHLKISEPEGSSNLILSSINNNKNLLLKARSKYDSLSSIPAHRFKTGRLQQINKLEYYQNQVDYFEKQLLRNEKELKSNIREKEKTDNKFIQNYSDKYFEFAILIMLLVFTSNFLVFYLNNLKTSTINNNSIKNIHEYNICNTPLRSSQVEDILKSDLSKTDKIKILYDANYSQKQIAEYLDVSQSTVSRSLNGII